MSIASWTSPAASGSTFPISCAIRSAKSSFCSARSWPKRKRTSPRRGAGTSRQSSYACLADSTARSTSSALERGKTPIVSPLAGLRLSKVSPEAASTHSPPMKFLNVLVVVATAAILFGWPHLLEVGRVPGRCEAGVGRRADGKDDRPVLRSDGGSGDRRARNRHDAHRGRIVLSAVQREAGPAADDEIELLLPALVLVVLRDELNAAVAAERVDAERADPEVVLERVPVEVVRIVSRDKRHLVEALDPVAAGARRSQAARCPG